MSFDGIATRAIVNELNKDLIGSRVEKIYVPSKNEVWIYIHTLSRKSVKLLLSIDANNGRFHLSEESRNNPEKAPQFCMVLRKYLTGAKLVSISQIGLDRIIFFTFEGMNDFGDIANKQIVLELMGKYSNIILLDDEKILDSMRHVDITMSSVREVLPGRKYILPTSLGKLNFEKIDSSKFINILKEQISTSEYEEVSFTNLISNIFVGFSKSFVSYILENLQLDMNFSKEKISDEILMKIYSEIFDTLKNKLEDYSSSLSLDDLYSKKENSSTLKTAKLNLERDVNSHISKLNKKLTSVLKTLEDENNLEKYKKYGELISSNIYKMQIGMDKLETEDFYNNNELIVIPLQINLSPSRNAQNYFKKYNKLKSAVIHAKEYKTSYENEIKYLESVLFEINEVTLLQELDEIREELISMKYIKKILKTKKIKDMESKPYEYEYNNVLILAGRNNIQNDKLTLKQSRKNYMWLHTKNVHGSHVIIQSEEIDDALLYYAATIAKKHSKAKDSSKVEVDYTLVKNVHKEVGANPGMVVYTDYKTIIV